MVVFITLGHRGGTYSIESCKVWDIQQTSYNPCKTKYIIYINPVLVVSQNEEWRQGKNKPWHCGAGWRHILPPPPKFLDLLKTVTSNDKQERNDSHSNSSSGCLFLSDCWLVPPELPEIQVTRAGILDLFLVLEETLPNVQRRVHC